MDGKSLNITEDKKAQLKQLFPEVFAEDKIDFEKLKQVLGEENMAGAERYELNWAGKSEAFREIQKQTTATLIPDIENSINFDTTENTFIEGENLEVLRALQKSYYGKVKMIYIDPPYNTGNDSFVYPDDYSERRDEYEKRTGIKDEEGYLNKEDLWKKNTKENGQFHSVWLSMMYPRLFLAKNLLKEDGVIFVSIGNDESANLKQLMNTVFGEENFIECITWNKRVPKNDTGIGNIHEHILLYAKNIEHKHKFLMSKKGIEEINSLVQKLKRKKTPITEAETEIKKLYEKRGFDRGITLYNSLSNDYRLWGKINMSWPNSDTFGPRYDIKHPKTGKIVKVPDRGWRWKKSTFLDEVDYDNIQELDNGSFMCGGIWFDKDENTQPSSILYLDQVNNLLLRSILSLKSDGGIEVEKLFEGKSYFSYPKPTSLVSMLLDSLKNEKEDSIILDFFSGSATTAHAVLDLNKEDGGKRKFICVQMPEPTPEDSEARKAGYETISQIAQDRIKKVIEKIKKEEPITAETMDLGFKSFKLQPSNFKTWRNDITGKELTEQIEAFTNPYKEGAEELNMLYEIILKAGLPLTIPIKETKVGKDIIYEIDGGKLIIALHTINPGIIEVVQKLQPQRFVTLDKLFNKQDELLTNTRLQLKEAEIDFQII